MPTDPTPDASLTPEERDALRALHAPATPSSELYASVSNGLRARGAFQRRGRSWFIAAGVAAAVVLGFFAGQRVGSAPAQSTDPAFALFLLNTPPVPRRPGVTDAQIVDEYRAWAGELAREGRLAFADELAPSRYLVDSAGSRAGALADGIDGMFVVRARDVHAALALAKTLPHARQGGVVAVQPIMVR